MWGGGLLRPKCVAHVAGHILGGLGTCFPLFLDPDVGSDALWEVILYLVYSYGSHTATSSMLAIMSRSVAI